MFAAVLFLTVTLLVSSTDAVPSDVSTVIRDLAATNQKLTDRLEVLEETVRKQNEQLSRAARAPLQESRVAFSAILSTSIDNIGPEQGIVFDNVLLDVGNGYSENTGAFTAPVDGVYVFTFFVGQRGDNQIFVHLTKNGQAIVEAGTEGTHDSHDTAGGNAVVLSLLAGDEIQVRHHIWGTHVEAGIPQTTFSGFLLYENSVTATIIG